MKKQILITFIIITTLLTPISSYATDFNDTDVYDNSVKIINIKNKDTINLKNNTLKLQEIKCDSIKIIGNNNIKKIDLVNSFAKKIKISKCSKLEKIEIHDIKSNEIKIEKCKNIKIIDVCTEERIKKLIIQNNKKLKKLSTFPSWEKISQIKLKKLKMLKDLNIRGIPIKKIDLSKYRKLKYVYLSYCKIKKVKIGKKNCIREIDLSHNKIKKINIRVLKKAYNIDVSYNKLKGRLMLPRLIYADANTIDCDNNKLKYIINPKNSCIWILCCNHNKLKTIDLNNAWLDILESRKNPGVKVYYASINRKRGGKSTRYIKKYKEWD